MYYSLRRHEVGIVSIIVVLITSMVIAIICIGFMRLMLASREQASRIDLSQSAYDSARGGVEDAKRLLVFYRDVCANGEIDTPVCTQLKQRITVSYPCNTMQQSGIAGSPDDEEVIVRTNLEDSILQQAYTCVKVIVNTDDYIGSLERGNSKLIPLRAEGYIDRVTIEWYSQTDMRDASGAGDKVNLADVSSSEALLLPKLDDWPVVRPTVLRAQFIQHTDDFYLSQFDKVDGGNNMRTLFLYPARNGLSETSFVRDAAGTDYGLSILARTDCDEHFSIDYVTKDYACRMTLELPPIVDGEGNPAERFSYLRVAPLYNGRTHFRVTLSNGMIPVKFDNVQPIVDSTGRANTLFRRIQSRVELIGGVYPENAVELSGNFCKTFYVTDNPDEYQANDAQCKPKP